MPVKSAVLAIFESVVKVFFEEYNPKLPAGIVVFARW